MPFLLAQPKYKPKTVSVNMWKEHPVCPDLLRILLTILKGVTVRLQNHLHSLRYSQMMAEDPFNVMAFFTACVVLVMALNWILTLAGGYFDF